MHIKSAPMGPYQTNCYIATIDNKDFIIDPGVDSLNWIIQNTTNPVAILNTHGHFDHVWSNAAVKEKFNIPIYCPTDDCFMLENDPFSQGTPSSKADVKVDRNQTVIIKDIKIKFHHFPGHTPGCSAIEIDNVLFSGDFIFQGSIGRADFPYSSAEDMIQSINKILTWQKDIKIYPGHGNSTSLLKEISSLKSWLRYL